LWLEHAKTNIKCARIYGPCTQNAFKCASDGDGVGDADGSLLLSIL